jgi:predicted O-methyltransferase YrrM
VTGPTAIDIAHASLVYGLVCAAKPRNLLELGVGTGLMTGLLLDAIEYNGVGHLTCVDNWLDWGGVEPPHIMGFRERGATIRTRYERQALTLTLDDQYDFLFSDADHHGDWCEEHFRVTRPGAFCFFHDTNIAAEYPGLARIEGYARSRGWMCCHFTESTRPGERCERGLLMVVNGKP